MEILFTQDHEMIAIEGNTGRISITDYAADKLGDITYIDLPSEGTSISKGEILCEIESVKAASDVYAPLSGKITEVNNNRADSPELLNGTDRDVKWIAVIDLQDLSEKDSLMTQEQYKDYLSTLE